MHFLDPVLEAINDERSHARVLAIDRVAAAAEIFVQAQVRRHQPVVHGIVDAAQGQQRSALVAFGRMIEDHVEDHLDSRGVQRPHHRLELDHGIVHRVLVRGRKPCDGIVAPIVAELALEQELFADEGLTGQQFHGRYAERFQVLDHRSDRQPEVGSAPLLRHRRMQTGESLHVQLIDHGIAPRNGRRPVVAPMKLGVNDARAQRVPRQRARIRIDQGHGGIEALAARRVIGAMNAKGILRARAGVTRRYQAMPDIAGMAGQIVT